MNVALASMSVISGSLTAIVAVGWFASSGSLFWLIGVTYGVLAFPALSFKVKLKGMSASAATSVPPLLTVNCAV